jgi:hypothetical protein
MSCCVGCERGFTTPPVDEFHLYTAEGVPVKPGGELVLATRPTYVFLAYKPGTATPSDFDGRTVHPAKQWGVYAHVYEKKPKRDTDETPYWFEFARYRDKDDPPPKEGAEDASPFVRRYMHISSYKSYNSPPPATPPVQMEDGKLYFAGPLTAPSKPGSYYLRIVVCPSSDSTELQEKNPHATVKFGRNVKVFEGTVRVP